MSRPAAAFILDQIIGITNAILSFGSKPLGGFSLVIVYFRGHNDPATVVGR